MDRVTRIQAIDLARGVAATEAAPFMRYIRVAEPLRAELPRLARLALPELEAEEGVTSLAGLPGELGSPEEVAQAVTVVVAVATVIVPTHGQGVEMYRWLIALGELEIEQRLVDAPLPAETRKDLRALVYAVFRVQEAVEEAERAFTVQWGSDGGWVPLLAIAQWAVFCRVWAALTTRVGVDGVEETVRIVAQLSATPLKSPIIFLPSIISAERTM